MKLVSFTIENFRSIVKAHKIGIDKSAILVGPNNEGKSNILRALVVAMSALTGGRGQRRPFRSHRRRFGLHNRAMYNWEVDFPIHLQGMKQKGQSIVYLEFELSKKEGEDFNEEIKSNLNGNLTLKIVFSREGFSINVSKQGRVAKALLEKSEKIALFVCNRIDFQYIPAIRTAESAQIVVDEMVERELEKLEELPAYRDSIKKIIELQKPVLNELSLTIKSTLSQFLPAIKDVKIRAEDEDRYQALRGSNEIIVDDGAPTPLELKGDGVQSLAALGIMRYASESGARGKQLVIAIEEPESHLHPKAIHELKSVIASLSQKHQVVITTHCPLFIDRSKLTNNIIVNKNKANPAKNIKEIREILGVKASDNLQHAELVLLVEGDDDRIALDALLKHHSLDIKSFLENGTLAIETLSGGTNLSYKVGLIKDALCNCHCFLDNDKCGLDAFEKAKNLGLLIEGDVNFSTVPNLRESELEDLYEVSTYQSVFQNFYRVNLNSPRFKGQKKWSDRIQQVFKEFGKPWNDKIEKEVKEKVAYAIADNPANALNHHKKAAFDSLLQTLNTRVDEIKLNKQ